LLLSGSGVNALQQSGQSPVFIGLILKTNTCGRRHRRRFVLSLERNQNPMRYEAPESLDAAIALLNEASGTARVLAGGTDLIVQMRANMVEPELVVDIKKIDEMCTISEENGAFVVGAAVTGAEMNEHAAFKAAWPGVCEATDLIGSTQIQSRATIGGNLCNGSPAADSVPAMIAADAVLTIAGPNGRRELAVEDLNTGPGKNTLEKGEIVVSFAFPARGASASDAYLRLTPRTEMDIAVVGVGVSLELDGDGTCTAARVGLGAVAVKALLVDEAAKALIGTKVDEAAIDAMAAATSAAAKPIDDKRGTKEYRIKIAGVLARRAAGIALTRARQN